MIKIKRCAIFGGTFDPFHNGHLHLVDWLISQEVFDQIIIVPSGDPWQKQTVASADHRLAMARLALAGRRVEISDIEIRRSGASYAIDTVHDLSEQFPSDRFTWILGSDAFLGITSWNRYLELIKQVDFLVIERPGYANFPKIDGIKYEIARISALEISATEIRGMLANGKSIENLVPATVASYIKEKNLYDAA